ncbi:hypothetical protein DL95DRAFT_388150 [Leptodontidium sp. 2 PMI_412]|nr:hypothetical protein DL95DRAFT_388150 [Leptodontidium sp. 2 PMI_412]
MGAPPILLIAISLIILILNLEAICYITIISSLIIWASLHCLEQHQLWTLRFRISLFLPNLILIPTASTLLLLSKLWILQAFNFSATSPSGRIPQNPLTFNFSTTFTSKFVDNFGREARASFLLKAWNFSDTTKEAILLLQQIAGKIQHVAEHIDYHTPRALLQIDGALKTLSTMQRISLSLATTFFLIFVARYIVPVVMNRRYLRLRWKAWAGPRRSCIVPHFSRLIGDEEDWKDIARAVQPPTPHPVENFSSLFPTTQWRISANPTDLLKACQSSDKFKEFSPKSSSKAGVYGPIIDGESLSLLWGPELGFQNRCCPDILTISPSLLTYRPTFGPGLDGRAICLAYGILSRNKGPRPWTLVCNLNTSDAIKVFEENSVQWPRPSTCFRSLYRAEFTRTFSSLGQSFVVSATELALLLADTSEELIEDWLDGGMDQQDLALNKRAAELGASPGELDRLYSGQYVAMLVSLAVHKKCERIRPEILVYEELCNLEGVDVEAQWFSDPSVVERKKQEVRHVGSAGLTLISAII